MGKRNMSQYIGILTSGGDCPGLNAAIRGVGKAGLDFFDMQVIGFRDGFRGLVQDQTLRIETKLAVRHSDRWRHDPWHQPRQAAQDVRGGQVSRHDRSGGRHL